MKRIINGTLHPKYASDPPRHWTAGCHGTVGFLRAVLRTVNIPVARIYRAGQGSRIFCTKTCSSLMATTRTGGTRRHSRRFQFRCFPSMRRPTRRGSVRMSIPQPRRRTPAAPL